MKQNQLLRAVAGLFGYGVLCLRFGPLREAATALLDLLEVLGPTRPSSGRQGRPSRAGCWPIALLVFRVLVANPEALILLGPPAAGVAERALEAMLP